MILVVTYDLKAPSSEYGQLYEYLKGHNGWAHYLKSTWLIDTNKTPDEVTDDLRSLIDSEDRFFVSYLGKDYQGWLPEKAWDWVRRHKG